MTSALLPARGSESLGQDLDWFHLGGGLPWTSHSAGVRNGSAGAATEGTWQGKRQEKAQEVRDVAEQISPWSEGVGRTPGRGEDFWVSYAMGSGGVGSGVLWWWWTLWMEPEMHLGSWTQSTLVWAEGFNLLRAWQKVLSCRTARSGLDPSLLLGPIASESSKPQAKNWIYSHARDLPNQTSWGRSQESKFLTSSLSKLETHWGLKNHWSGVWRSTVKVAAKDFPCPVFLSLFVTFNLILSGAASWLFCKVIFPSYRKCACVHPCGCTCVCIRLFPMKPWSICYMKPRPSPWGSKRKQNKTAHIKGQEEQKQFGLTRHWAGLICSPLRSKSGMQGTIQHKEDRQLSCGQGLISGGTGSLLLTLLRVWASIPGPPVQVAMLMLWIQHASLNTQQLICCLPIRCLTGGASSQIWGTCLQDVCSLWGYFIRGQQSGLKQQWKEGPDSDIWDDIGLRTMERWVGMCEGKGLAILWTSSHSSLGGSVVFCWTIQLLQCTLFVWDCVLNLCELSAFHESFLFFVQPRLQRD